MTTQGERIKKIREELRLNQEEFASIFGFSRVFVSAIEKNKSKLSVDNLVKLLVTYNVNMNYVLGGIGEMFIQKEPAGLKDEIRQTVLEMLKNGELPKDKF